MHTFCDGRPYLRVIGTGYLTVHSKFGVSLTFGSGVIVCQGNIACETFMYYWFPVATLRQLSVSFHIIGKLQDPAAACPIFVVVAASTAARCH